MIEKIVTGVAVALLGFIGRTLWRNRQHVSLLRLFVTPWWRMRVSVAVLLRLQDEDHYVLFDSLARPGAFGPPGGVVKYQDQARHSLDGLGFEAEMRSREMMRNDLRGFLPAWHVPGFAQWLRKGSGREPWTECLRRELVEELDEVGHSELAPAARSVNFVSVRSVIDGPLRVSGESYRQIRFIEVYDLLVDGTESAGLRTSLLSLARDETDPHVVGASRNDIARGRVGAFVIAPQSAFLIGGRRLREDMLPVT